MSHLCKQFYDERLPEKNICKKTLVFWFLVKDFNFSYIFLQNPKHKLMATELLA